MKHIHAVAGILWRGGTFLAAERPSGKIMAGYWEFPGGKIERGETPPEALARELAEELGISISGADMWRTIKHASGHGRVILHIFIVTSFSGEPCPLENQKIRWVTPGDALELNFLPVDMPLIRELALPPAGRVPENKKTI